MMQVIVNTAEVKRHNNQYYFTYTLLSVPDFVPDIVTLETHAERQPIQWIGHLVRL